MSHHDTESHYVMRVTYYIKLPRIYFLWPIACKWQCSKTQE